MRTALSALVAFTTMALAPGPVDLAEVLAPPPSSDYVDAAGSEQVLNGPFGPHRYAQWLAPTSSDVGPLESLFNHEGLKRGYARSWSALSHAAAPLGSDRHNWLIETVEEYAGAKGAQARFEGVVNYTKSGGDHFVHEIEIPIQNAFAALIAYGRTYFVMFVKGNDVYIVRMASDLDDMSVQLVPQAQAQYDIAPAYSIPPDQWVDAQAPGNHDAPNGKTILSGSIVGLILAGSLLLLVARLRRRSA